MRICDDRKGLKQAKNVFFCTVMVTYLLINNNKWDLHLLCGCHGNKIHLSPPIANLPKISLSPHDFPVQMWLKGHTIAISLYLSTVYIMYSATSPYAAPPGNYLGSGCLCDLLQCLMYYIHGLPYGEVALLHRRTERLGSSYSVPL